MEGMDPQTVDMIQKGLEAFYASAKAAYAMGGWLGLAAAALIGAVNAYQAPFVQDRLPYRLQWDGWSLGGKIAFVFFGSFAGALLTALAAKIAIGAALISAAGVGIAAVLGHRYILSPVGKTQAAAKVAASMPVSVSRAVSLVVPIDPVRLAGERLKRMTEDASKALK
jgi:hypothetical protein